MVYFYGRGDAGGFLYGHGFADGVEKCLGEFVRPGTCRHHQQREADGPDDRHRGQQPGGGPGRRAPGAGDAGAEKALGRFTAKGSRRADRRGHRRGNRRRPERAKAKERCRQ